METIIEIIAGPLGVALSILITFGLTWALAKLGLSVSPALQAEVVNLAKYAVEKVEGIARDQLTKMPSESKLKAALDIIDREAEKRPELKRAIRGRAEELVETVLRNRLTPDSLTPK